MKTAPIIAGFLLLFAFASPANAWIHGRVLCPYSAGGYPDGCAGAPISATYFHANFFNGYANQSGQVWTQRPPWNVAGVDYAVGNYTAENTMADPTTAALPPGCTWVAGSDWVSCTGSGALVIRGYDFSLHNGIRLYIHGSYSSITLDDNYFVNGSSSDVADGNQVQINDEGNASPLVVSSNYFDGNAVNFPVNQQTVVYDLRTTAGSTTLVKYNVCRRVQERCYEMAAAGQALDTFEYNYTEEFDHGGGGHGEMQLLGGGTGTLTNYLEQYDTTLQPTVVATGGSAGTTAMSYISSGVVGLTVTTVNVNNNVYVVNVDPGGAALASAGVEMSYGSYGTVNFTQNWLAPTGVLSCYSLISGATAATTNWTGNVNMYDNSTISAYGTCNGHHP